MRRTLDGARIGLLTSSASRLGGGVFEAVAVQAQIIAARGGKPLVFALNDQYAFEDRRRFGDATVTAAGVLGPHQIGYAPTLLKELLRANLDCLHLHGIWMYPSHAAWQWARLTGRGYIISPHGMLDPWVTARSRWKKAFARAGYERASWAAASFFHALTAREVADIQRESGRGDSIVIANAAPNSIVTSLDRELHVIYVGRIHAKKNVLALVNAWNLASLPKGSKLTIAGWGDPRDVAALRSAIARCDGTVRFIGPVYGAAKEELFANARYMILPSLGEGLPMAVLESWAAGTPVIMTQECHLPEGFAAGAAIECGALEVDIASAIERALLVDADDWRKMSHNSSALAAGPFSTETIASRWVEAYARAIATGSGNV